MVAPALSSFINKVMIYEYMILHISTRERNTCQRLKREKCL
jgi:hypothetical protein